MPDEISLSLLLYFQNNKFANNLIDFFFCMWNVILYEGVKGKIKQSI